VEALRSHGRAKEATLLAASIARAMRRNQISAEEKWTEKINSSAPKEKEESFVYSEAWIGHPLDPLGVLFDTLVEGCPEASISRLSKTSSTSKGCNYRLDDVIK